MDRKDYMDKIRKLMFYLVEGLQDLTLELKKIGTHLDKIDKQMIKDNNSCRNELHDVKEEMSEAWQLLRQLIQKTR